MTRKSSFLDTAGAIAGIIFAVLLLFGLASVDPLREATDEELVQWWSESGNQRDTLISLFFMLASIPFFLFFLTSLRARLAAAERHGESLTNFVFAAGICFAAVVLVGDSARGVVAYSVKLGDEPLPGPDTLRYLTSLSTVMFGTVAMPLAAIMVGGASAIIVRTKVLGAWLGWAGLGVAAATIIAVVLLIGPFASPLLQLWVVAASIQLWRTREGGESRAPELVPSRAGA